MAKEYRIVKLVSEPDDEPRHYYTTTIPTKGMKASNKLRLKKYNPRAMKHMWYKQVRKLK